jgi:hypothetical protein
MPRATRAFAQYFLKVESVRTGNTGPLGCGLSSLSRRSASGESGDVLRTLARVMEEPVAPVDLLPPEIAQHAAADPDVGTKFDLDAHGLAE